LELAEVMMKRIREQLEANAGFKTAGVLRVSATAVQLPSRDDGKSLEELVQAVAEQVTEMARLSLAVHNIPLDANGRVSTVGN
jgi:hypothetical protein